MAKLAFITCSDLSRFFPDSEEPLLTHDDRMAAEWLRSKNHTVEPLIWNTTSLNDWKRFDCLILRSTWDYSSSVENCKRFSDWLQKLDEYNIPILNSSEVMLWNLHKRYLLELKNHGIPIIPTRLIPKGGDLPEENAKGVFVTKPAISAGARNTEKHNDYNELQKTFSSPKYLELRSMHDFLIQPFLNEISEVGEWSLVFLNGQYSHSVHKKPKKGSWFVQDELGGSVSFDQPCTKIIDCATQSYAAMKTILAPHEPLYARIDIIPSKSGPLISEIELIEPELFFRTTKANGGFEVNEFAMRKFELGIVTHITKVQT